MDFLKGLFANPTMIRIATDKLRSLFTDDGINTIVLRVNPHNLQPPLPGFDVIMFKEETAVLQKSVVDDFQKKIAEYPFMISEFENEQFEALKRFATWVFGQAPEVYVLEGMERSGLFTKKQIVLLEQFVPTDIPEPTDLPTEKPLTDGGDTQL
jgi:hypothetical protein